MSNIEPKSGYIIGVKADSDRKTESGLLLKNKVRDDSIQVIAVGPNVDGIELDELIIPRANSAEKITLDGTDYYLIFADDVIAKVEKS